MCDKPVDIRIKIDWDRIPARYGEVRLMPAGGVWAGRGFRVITPKGEPVYRNYSAPIISAASFYACPIIARRPLPTPKVETRKDYAIRLEGVPGVTVRPSATQQEVLEYIQKCGYSGQLITVYELVEAAKSTTTIVWSEHADV